jgi:hypothetical protein
MLWFAVCQTKLCFAAVLLLAGVWRISGSVGKGLGGIAELNRQNGVFRGCENIDWLAG